MVSSVSAPHIDIVTSRGVQETTRTDEEMAVTTTMPFEPALFL